MATPMKRNEYFVVPDKTVCVACSKESKQRYFVRTKQGCAGPSLKLVNKFYGACFDRVENDGAFLCIGCKRLTERILEMVSKSEELTTSLNNTSQKFKLMHVTKRARVETPGRAKSEKCSRIKTPQLKSPYMKSFSGASSSKSKRSLDFSQSDVKDVLDTAVQCELVGVQRVSEKKEVHQYYSISHKRNLQPAVRCLTSGSIRKGMRLLLTNADATVKEKAVAGVTDVIRQECRMLQKDVFQTSKDSLEFSLSETTDSIKTMPITWCVLNTVAENKNKVSDSTKVTTAACLLLNSRSKFMSKLQHNVAVSLYNNHLQKEGFEVLHKLGITVGHSTLQRTLNIAAASSDEKIYALKSRVEENRHIEVQVSNNQKVDHDYAAPADGSVVNDADFEPGYRFNLDNLDFYLRVRDMTETHQNQSKHYVQIMAVKDRVNCEHLPDEHPIGDLNQVENQQLMPSAEDNNDLREDMIHILSLTLIQHLVTFLQSTNTYLIGPLRIPS